MGDAHYPGARFTGSSIPGVSNNIPPEDLRDFEVIVFVDGHLWWHKVLIKKAPVVEECD